MYQGNESRGTNLRESEAGMKFPEIILAQK